MRKRLTKLALLGALVASSIQASEMRSPYIDERGPISYVFEKSNPDRYSLDVYSTGHYRSSSKAFLKQGTKAQPLTALIFNKSDFTFNEIFPDSDMPKQAKYYNPFMNVLGISPRATYYEFGVNLGLRWEYPVYKDKGRIGFRANVPFRTIEIEREDITDKNADPTEDVVVARWVDVSTGDGFVTPIPTVSVYVKAYKWTLLKALLGGSDGSSAVSVGTSTAMNVVKVFGQTISYDWDTSAKSIKGLMVGTAAGIIRTADGYETPVEPSATQAWAFNSGNAQDMTLVSMKKHIIPNTGATAEDASAALLEAGDTTLAKGIEFFSTSISGAVSNYYGNITTANQSDMWLVFGYNNGQLEGGAKNIQDNADAQIARYNENPYQWLLDKGDYEFETTRRTGFGDVDLDLFYEHHFNDNWTGELMVGLRFPTGGGNKYYGNPYDSHLGNGEHWEIGLGGLIAWHAIDWMNVKLDAKFMWALEGTEERCAAYEGATIKNIGPKADADVDWQYFLLHLDFTMFHPKTKDLYSTIGYEFYYKTKDSIKYKNTTTTPWYGATAGAAYTGNQGGVVSNKLAETGTESIGHKIRFEGTIKLNEWTEAFAGGTYMFAGQYVTRDSELYGGVNIKF